MYRADPQPDPQEASSNKARYLLCYSLGKIYNETTLQSRALSLFPSWAQRTVQFALRFFALIGAIVTFPYTIYGLVQCSRSKTHSLVFEKLSYYFKYSEWKERLIPPSFGDGKTFILSALNIGIKAEDIVETIESSYSSALMQVLEEKKECLLYDFVNAYDDAGVSLMWENCVDDFQRYHILSAVCATKSPPYFRELFEKAQKKTGLFVYPFLKAMDKNLLASRFFDSPPIKISPQMLLALDGYFHKEIQDNWPNFDFSGWKECDPLVSIEPKQLKKLVPFERLEGEALARTLQALQDVKIPLAPILQSFSIEKIHLLSVVNDVAFANMLYTPVQSLDENRKKAFFTSMPPSLVIRLSVFKSNSEARQTLIKMKSPFAILLAFFITSDSDKSYGDSFWCPIAANLFLSLSDKDRQVLVSNFLNSPLFNAILEENKNNESLLKAVCDAVPEHLRPRFQEMISAFKEAPQQAAV